jgi:hypothetical protein
MKQKRKSSGEENVPLPAGGDTDEAPSPSALELEKLTLERERLVHEREKLALEREKWQASREIRRIETKLYLPPLAVIFSVCLALVVGIGIGGFIQDRAQTRAASRKRLPPVLFSATGTAGAPAGLEAWLSSRGSSTMRVDDIGSPLILQSVPGAEDERGITCIMFLR